MPQMLMDRRPGRVVVGLVAVLLALTAAPDSARAAASTPVTGAAAGPSFSTVIAAEIREASASAAGPTGTYLPRQGVLFNHWNMKSRRNTIRRHVLRSINSVPRGGTIRWIVFSFGDTEVYKALNRARLRGVSVQVLGNFHNRETWEPWRRLEKAFGTKLNRPGWNPERVSWARMCDESCRGWGGHVHLKLFLFSKVGNADNVTMFGSWNPTWVANQRQWNHLETTWDPEVYTHYLQIFAQAKRDRPVRYQPFTTASGDAHYVFPKEGTHASTDPVLRDLAPIRCTGVTNGAGKNERTLIRIGMYAWYGNRGAWMARRVRQLWNQGCDVAIIYGVMSNGALRMLYSPSGRGRIPMRQAMVPDAHGVPYRYLHDKFVVVSGVYGDKTDATMTWSGSTNFSNLGFDADDMTVRTANPTTAAAYFADWNLTWRGRNVHSPRPGGVVHAEGRTTAAGSNKLSAPLGKGIYRNLEAD